VFFHAIGTALLEQQRLPRRKVCGECVAASNLPLLEMLGIGDAFDAMARRTAAAGGAAAWGDGGHRCAQSSLPAARSSCRVSRMRVAHAAISRT